MRLVCKNSIWSSFKNKKILIIVSHQDDELFLCGTIMGSLKKVTNYIYVVFTTNGDYGAKFDERKRECIKALSIYGIKKNNIIFLGYGDLYDTEFGHMYHAPIDEVVQSKFGKKCTYSDCYCKKKYGKHHEYTYNNFKSDLYDVINSIYPDVIFCNDIDWHPEHRFTSLMFDKVMGEILNEIETYRPEIYKGFVYFIGWDGNQDYNFRKITYTKRPHRYQMGDKRFELENPYFLWNSRIRFPVDVTLIKRRYNKLYLAICKYKFSKHAKTFFDSMMNSDAVFWKRNSKNLLFKATINTSSGEARFLNDFVIVDTGNIIKRKFEFDKSIWYPSKSDITPKINIEFDKPVRGNHMVLYRDILSYGLKECCICVCVRGYRNGQQYERRIDYTIKKNDILINFQMDLNIDINNISIFMDSPAIGFSEIELLDTYDPRFLKILINGNYVYEYSKNIKENTLNIDVYKCGCESENVLIDIIEPKPREDSISLINNKIVFKKNFKSCYLKAYLKNDNSIFDIIRIKKR